jgi:four helix bundle protein
MRDEQEKRAVDLKSRTKAFALRVIRLCPALPQTTAALVMGEQALRSETSVGAHYPEAIRSRSTAASVGKVEGALQESAETSYWLELLGESGLMHDVNGHALTLGRQGN